jgi:hypothetical protein
MQFSQKLTMTLPLNELSSTDGTVFLRGTYLNKQSVKGLLKKGPIPFIVADVGHPLKLISTGQCFPFWKTEVKDHVADDLDYIDLDLYRGNYAYIASEWIDANLSRLILLEKVH